MSGISKPFGGCDNLAVFFLECGEKLRSGIQIAAAQSLGYFGGILIKRGKAEICRHALKGVGGSKGIFRKPLF